MAGADNGSRRTPAALGHRVEDSVDLYAVDAWGAGYFGVNAAGHVVVRPSQEAAREIDLYEVVTALRARDLTAPMVIRFSDILRHRLKALADAFNAAIAEHEELGSLARALFTGLSVLCALALFAPRLLRRKLAPAVSTSLCWILFLLGVAALAPLWSAAHSGAVLVHRLGVHAKL